MSTSQDDTSTVSTQKGELDSCSGLAHDPSTVTTCPHTEARAQQEPEHDSEPEGFQTEVHRPDSRDPAGEVDSVANASDAACSPKPALSAAEAGEAQQAAGSMQDAETSLTQNQSTAMHAAPAEMLVPDHEEDQMPPYTEAFLEAASLRTQTTDEWESADELPQHHQPAHDERGLDTSSGKARSAEADTSTDHEHTAGASEAGVSMQPAEDSAQAAVEGAQGEVARDDGAGGSGGFDDGSDDGFGDFEEAGGFAAAAEPPAETLTGVFACGSPARYEGLLPSGRGTMGDDPGIGLEVYMSIEYAMQSPQYLWQRKTLEALEHGERQQRRRRRRSSPRKAAHQRTQPPVRMRRRPRQAARMRRRRSLRLGRRSS